MSMSGYVYTELKDEEAVGTEEGTLVLTFSQILKTDLSSDEFADFVSAALGPADVLSTWGPRYSGVLETIMNGPGHMGSFIELTSQNPELAVLFYLILIMASSYNVYRQYQQQKAVNEAKQNTHRLLRKRMGIDDETLQEEEKKSTFFVRTSIQHNAQVKAAIDDLNRVLQTVVKEEESKKYKSIQLHCPTIPMTERKKITPDDIQVVYTFQNKPKKPGFFRKSIDKVISPLYTGLSLASFTYWILWITAAVTVGTFADAGIAGLSSLVAFGVPALIALPYVGIKIKNYFKNRKGVSDEQARLTKIVEGDNAEIFGKVFQQVQYDREIQTLQDQLQAGERSSTLATSTRMPNDDVLGINRGKQAVAAGYTTLISQVGLAQYNAWIVSDFFKVGPSIAFSIPYFGEVAGGILIAIGVGLALYEGYKRYQHVKNQKASGAPVPEKSLSEIFKEKSDRLQELNNTRDQALDRMKNYEGFVRPKLSPMLNKPLPKPPVPLSKKQMLYNFFDWNTTGIFFARLFFVAGTAIFLPFAAAALSNPITLTILAVSGLAFFGAKLYQAKQKQKEAEAREYIAKIKEMDQQIHIAELTQQVLDKNEKTLRQNQDASSRAAVVTNAPSLSLVNASSPRVSSNVHTLYSEEKSVELVPPVQTIWRVSASDFVANP